MRQALSLRIRLTLIILLPLLMISLAVGVWAQSIARETAQERFDRSLLSTALAISRDVALSGGDALSAATRDLISDTSGGGVFYHVYAPDGVFVTGYATPPVPARGARSAQAQTYYEALYFGAPVRALRLREPMEIDGLSGDVTLTVWQRTEVRDAFVADRLWQNVAVIGTLTASVGLIVWFGVGFGLRPLSDLQAALARRSSDDLAPIRRPVPAEVRGIVGTLNDLLGQVSGALAAKNAFISDAAHQLRNPIAGVFSMAEALDRAPDEAALRARAGHVLDAARKARDLANQLLTLERAKGPVGDAAFVPVDLGALATALVEERKAQTCGAALVADVPEGVEIKGDPVMLKEALGNLLDNALVHGGDLLSKVVLSVTGGPGGAVVAIEDDGVGIAPDMRGTALERFGQVGTSQGSGLGLPIAAAVAAQHGGHLRLADGATGLRVEMCLPLGKVAASRTPIPAHL